MGRTDLYYEVAKKKRPKVEKEDPRSEDKNVFDPTMGSKLLIAGGQENYNKKSEDERFKLWQDYEIFIEQLKGDWMQVFGQYGFSRPKIGDYMWARELFKMIAEGALYIRIFRLKHWAYPDANFEENRRNLIEGLTQEIYLHEGAASDGTFGFAEELEMYKFRPENEDEVPDDDKILVPKHMFGVVEYGYQHICKTACSLKMGHLLIRVPYEIEKFELGPCAVVLFNINCGRNIFVIRK
jgi:hypothetical protein